MSHLQLVAPGRYLRFPQLYERTRPLVICPLDDTFIFGPFNGLEVPRQAMAKVIEGKPDAVLTFLGSATRYARELAGTPIIINLSLSTVLSRHATKVSAHSIHAALQLPVAAVAFHVNLLSEDAPEMLASAASMISAASEYQIPTLGIIYPRGDGVDHENRLQALRENDPDRLVSLVSQCASVGVDLGFDVIKTFYTGSVEGFAKVTQAAGDVPVVVAGGPKKSERSALALAQDAIRAGAAGVSFGRNVFGRSNPAAFISKLRTALG